MAARNLSTRYDEHYFAHGLGRPYVRDEYWLGFFGVIADRIASDIGPTTVLDAGCALGFLVEALRNRGIEAYGFDISEFAIANVHPSVKPYCWVASATEPLSRRYDLIVSVEVLEHLARDDAERAVANLCAHTDDVLFSSSPEDFREATHVNVQPPEYWASLFARHSFFRDTEIEPFVTPWSVRFRRMAEPINRVVAGYERRLWRLEREARGAREVVLEQRAQLARHGIGELTDDSAVQPSEELQNWLSEVFFRSAAAQHDETYATEANVPLAIHPVGDVFNIQRGGHSLWVFRAERGALSIDATLTPQSYVFNGRAVAGGPSKLVFEPEVGEPAVIAELADGIQDFSRKVEVGTPTSRFTVRLEGAPPFALLGDFHVLRVDDDRAPETRARRTSAIARGVAGRLRRARALAASDPSYATWREARLAARGQLYQPNVEPGLFSLLTSAWNTPPSYLRALAASVFGQTFPEFEWIVLDNGSTDSNTKAALQELSLDPRVKLARVEDNLGIVGGVQHCFERAAGRYVLPLDSDDLLTPDAIAIVAWYLREYGYPPLLYTDEDKIRDGHYETPYFKPDWDPVLFLNSCYIAHLCAVDRTMAAEFGAYTDPAAEGSHDWDTFMRFALSGRFPAHAPEIVYTWRMHESSAALNIESKPFVGASHKAVLQRFLKTSEHPNRYRVEPSPLFRGTPDWWFRRSREGPRPLLTIGLGDHHPHVPDERHGYPRTETVLVSPGARLPELRRLVHSATDNDSLVLLIDSQVTLEDDTGLWDALALFELHADTVAVGGRSMARIGGLSRPASTSAPSEHPIARTSAARSTTPATSLRCGSSEPSMRCHRAWSSSMPRSSKRRSTPSRMNLSRPRCSGSGSPAKRHDSAGGPCTRRSSARQRVPRLSRGSRGSRLLNGRASSSDTAIASPRDRCCRR